MLIAVSIQSCSQAIGSKVWMAKIAGSIYKCRGDVRWEEMEEEAAEKLRRAQNWCKCMAWNWRWGASAAIQELHHFCFLVRMVWNVSHFYHFYDFATLFPLRSIFQGTMEVIKGFLDFSILMRNVLLNRDSFGHYALLWTEKSFYK